MQIKRDYKQPRFTVSNRDCTCSKCNGNIHKGDSVKFDPQTKEVICSKCFKSKDINVIVDN